MESSIKPVNNQGSDELEVAPESGAQHGGIQSLSTGSAAPPLPRSPAPLHSMPVPSRPFQPDLLLSVGWSVSGVSLLVSASERVMLLTCPITDQDRNEPNSWQDGDNERTRCLWTSVVPRPPQIVVVWCFKANTVKPLLSGSPSGNSEMTA